MNEDGIQVNPGRLLEIIQEENPQAFELALRRAIIEQQRSVIATLHAATMSTPNGEHAS